MMKRAALTAAVLMAVCAGTVPAEPDPGDIFQFHAFGTLGVAHSTQEKADFVTSYYQQPQGAGYTKRWSPDVDSKAAVQGDATFTEKLSATVQLISESNDNMSWTGKINPRYRPSLEWANLKYDVTDEWTIRAGRMVLPINMISEYRNVGYALPFLRPPIEVYGGIPFTNFDGGELIYAKHFGTVTNTVVFGGGSVSLRLRPVAVQDNVFLLTDTIEAGALTVHVTFNHTTFRSPTGFGTLFTGFADAAAEVPGGSAAASTARYLNSRFNYNHCSNVEVYELGAMYDSESWLFIGELERGENQGVVGTANSGFITFGYRTHGLTPYLTYARVKTQRNAAPEIPLAGLPPPLAAYGAAINGVIAGVDATKYSQRDLSLGLRWDFMRHLDFKVQYDYVRLDADSIGFFVNQQPGFRPGSTAGVFSAAIDFEF